ncbi:MAG: Fic family protein [Ktedonobacterales bacterium]|nr:Fic family protein [Ktedonobacterales bacterium]
MPDYTLPMCGALPARKALLERFGGLPDTTVQNTEWLYMLGQDTRHSLAIEGYFASEEDLEAVLRGQRSSLEITTYFRTAQTVYDQALQYYRDCDLRLDLSLVRHVHSELFRGQDERRGQFRIGGVRILHARVQPPEFDVGEYLRAAIQIALEDLAHMPILTALARVHTLFESIHPFPDGNGRVGRILLNYLAISQGYPPIVIKGMSADERKRYYAALEAADTGFHGGFPEEASPAALRARLDAGDLEPLTRLLCEGLLPRLTRLTALALETREPLMELPELAARLGVKEPALRKRIERGTLLAIKRGKRVYSHPLLAL